jgi:hypothetical protein
MADSPGFRLTPAGLQGLAQCRWQGLLAIAAGPGHQQLQLRAGCRSQAAGIDRPALSKEPVPLVLQPVQQDLSVAILAQSPEVIARSRFDLALTVSKQQLGSLQPQPTGSPDGRSIATSHQLSPVG